MYLYLEFGWLEYPFGYLKLCALLFLIINLLLYSCFSLQPTKTLKLHILLTANGGWAILLSFIILGYVYEENLCRGFLQEFVVLLCGFIAQITAGVVMLDDFGFKKNSDKRSPAVIYASLSFLTAMVFLTDSCILYGSGVTTG